MAVELRVLGSPDLLDGSGKTLHAVLVQPKRFGLFVFLALSRPAGFHQREELLALFWPDQSEERARNALNQALSFLRRSLGSDILLSRGADEVGVDLTLLSCDALAFVEAANRGDEEAVLARYAGELLPAFHVDDAPAFGDWLEQERRFLRNRAVAAASSLDRRRDTYGDFTRAVDWALHGDMLAPCDETLARRVVLLHDRSGNPGRAIQAYDEYVARLRQELDLAKVMEHLGTIPAYRREFRAVFGRDFDPDGVAQAIATYVRTILSGDSPYDRFQAGDQRAMSEEAQRGLRLFEGKAMCTRCRLGRCSDGRRRRCRLHRDDQPTPVVNSSSSPILRPRQPIA